MKILQINKFHYLKGGSERHYFELSKLLSANGHEVVHFSMQDPANQDSPFSGYFIDPVNLERFSLKNIAKFFSNWDARRRLTRLLRAERPEIAHLHNINHQLTPSIIPVLKRHGLPVVMTLHAYDLICPNAQLYTQGSPCQRCRGGRYYECVRRKCVKQSYAKSLLAALELVYNRHLRRHYDLVDLFIAPSRFLAETAAAFGLPEDKIVVLPNFLGDDQFDTLAAPAATKGKSLLYFGRLAEEKGVADLLAAVAKIDNLELRVVGAGPEAEGLADLTQGLDLGERVKFLGYLDTPAVVEEVKAAGAVVLPARWPENMPYSLLEALAAGTPIIVARSGGLTELLEPGKNGFAYEPGDLAGLVAALKAWQAADQAVLEQGARATAARFRAEIFYHKLEPFYQKLLHKK